MPRNHGHLWVWDSGVCSLQEFHEGGEREVMLQEMSPFRDQLLEALDGKIAVDEGLVPQVSLADLAILD